MNTNLSAEDQEIIDQVISPFKQWLSAAYDVVFGPINRLLSYFERSDTQRVVASVEAASTRKQ